MLLVISCTGSNKTSSNTAQNEAEKTIITSVDSTAVQPAATNVSVNSSSKDDGMSGRKTVLIFGQVSKVTYSDGRFYEFNKDGNIVRKKDDLISNNIVIYSYVNKNRYKIENDAYNITYTKNSRHEIWDNPEKLETFYEFDNQGRLSKEGKKDYFEFSVLYYYKDNETQPYKVVEKTGDEGGSQTTTSLYNYKTFDNNGNWLSCDIKSTIVINEVDDDGKDSATTKKENKSLTRKIEYYQ